MKYKLYGLFSGDVGKIEDTAQAYSEELNLHLAILANENYMYEYMLDRQEEGHSVRMSMLHELPGADVEATRVALVYTLRPIGNWHEWHLLEEKEESERLGQ